MKYVLMALTALVLTACAAGKDFNRVDYNQQVLGKTTSTDILQQLGSPFKTGTQTENGETVKVLLFSYAKAGDGSSVKGVLPSRSQIFYFHEDVLVGSEFTSSWAKDSTDFDGSVASSIKENKTTVDGVIELLGQPVGEFMFPLIESKEDRAMVYYYNQTKVFGLDISVLDKRLVLSYNPATKTVTKVDYEENEVE